MDLVDQKHPSIYNLVIGLNIHYYWGGCQSKFIKLWHRFQRLYDNDTNPYLIFMKRLKESLISWAFIPGIFSYKLVINRLLHPIEISKY